MDFNNLLTKTCIKDLKCSICDNYLSYFPIYLTTKNQNICGRCKVPKQEDVISVQNKVYEMIAEDVKFPCRYVNGGCVEKLFPKYIPQHEKQCSFRVIKCPANEFNLCKESIVYPDLENHCQKKHSDHVLKNGEFTIDLSKSEESNHILIENSDFFIFKKNFDSTSTNIKFTLYCFQSDKNDISDMYNICLKNEYNSFTTEGAVDKSPCIKELYLDFLKTEKPDSIIKGKLWIRSHSTKRVTDIISQTTTLNEKFLEILKCIVCKKYIQLTDEGFYLKADGAKCIPCGRNLNTYRHFLFREDHFIILAKNELIYPCEYQKSGCNFTAKLSQHKEHQSNCLYGDSQCIFKEHSCCGWSGLRKDIIPHIIKDHSRMIPRSPTFYFNYNHPATWLLKFSGYYFRLSFSKRGDDLRWAVQMIGEFQDIFYYELDIFKDCDAHKKLKIVQACRPAVPENSIFSDPKQYCYFQLNQLESLLNTDYLRFRINIFKSS